jgi:hypothetical protein
MAARNFLIVSTLIWLPYGVFCFFQPGFLEGAAGVRAISTTATTELRAMYGGLQAAIGVLAALAVLREDLRRSALIAIGFLTAGLGLSRLGGAVLDGEVSSYTGSAIAFELISAAVAAWIIQRRAERTA